MGRLGLVVVVPEVVRVVAELLGVLVVARVAVVGVARGGAVGGHAEVPEDEFSQ